MSWEVGQTLYRAEYDPVYRMKTRKNPDAESGWIYVRYHEYEVLRLTPEGAWLIKKDDKGRPWAKETWRKPTTKFVWETKEKALESLKIRAKKYVQHCKRRLMKAKERAENLGVPDDETKFISLPRSTRDWI